MNNRLFTLTIAACALTQLGAQTDVTSTYIKNPSFESGFTNWTTVALQLQSNTSFTYKEGSLYAEKWVSSGNWVGTASATQTITGLPAGEYTLTVAAQNYNQASTSDKCSGTYIYAGEEQTPVYTPGDYSVSFTNLSGTVQIGFSANNASGNWLAVDNFRLYRVADIANQVLVDSLAAQVVIADSLCKQTMEQWVCDSLAHVTDSARVLTIEHEQSVLQSALAQMDVLLDKARFAIALAQATPGSGTAPEVTRTVTVVPTGATEALMRANMSGSNILERGVCWSKEHNPTVLNDRTTEYFYLNGNIYHITGLKPATVYYLRPYVMNNTYTVAYGDEVKIVTHPKGNCVGTWDNGAPTEAANQRCITAINQTIEYFNEWTGIRGFTLSGHYGASTATADCSYGGWMRIGPNEGNQAIGTVIHETGHGVGVGTSSRWWDSNYRTAEKYWRGRETTTMYQFLENQLGNSNYFMKADDTHAWGANATYDWFVNGADKDTHLPLQYIGGCVLLHSYFVDGLCPTSSHPNGVPSYTYNYDEDSVYYLMCKDPERGLDAGLLSMKESYTLKRAAISMCLNDQEEIPAEAAWKLEFDPSSCLYALRHVATGTYLSHALSSSMQFKNLSSPTTNEQFQLIPDHTDVTLTNNGASITTHGYWMTWYNSENKAFTAHTTSATGYCTVGTFDASPDATLQQWIILTESQVRQLKPAVSAIEEVSPEKVTPSDAQTVDMQGRTAPASARGLVVNRGQVMFKK